jgi:hypothetical protein
LPVPKQFTDIQSTRSSISLFKIADYFDVKSLQEEAASLLGVELTVIAKKIQKAGAAFLKTPPDAFSEKDIGDYFYAAKTAYGPGSSSFATLRGVVSNFLAQTRFVVGKDARFGAFLEGVPELAVDMVKLLMQSDSHGTKSLVVTDSPYQCDGCSKSHDFYANTWVSVSMVYDDEISVHGHCSACHAKKKPGSI